LFEEFLQRVGDRLVTPALLNDGEPVSVAQAMNVLDPSHHGSIDPIEGVIYRVERKGKVDFLAKYVRPDKVDGCYLPELSDGVPVWNWTP
jgi:hypothetical protein